LPDQTYVDVFDLQEWIAERGHNPGESFYQHIKNEEIFLNKIVDDVAYRRVMDEKKRDT